MNLLAFETYSLWLLIAIFAASAVAVWIAGTKLAGYAAIISERTGFGQALVGLVLLGGITSLPEVATSVTASWSGNAALAVNNLLGGVAMQVVVLAIGDLFIGKKAVTGTLLRPHIVLQAALSIVLLVLVAAGIIAGDIMLFGFGAWSLSVLIAYLLTLWIAQSAEGRVVWISKEIEERKQATQADGHKGQAGGESEEISISTRRVVLKTIAAGVVILIAGFVLTKTGEAIAEATGLGQSFFGAVFLAIATSLPELSSVISALRHGHAMLAIGDVLGGNLFDLALIFVVDVIYEGGPVLNEVGTFSAFAALLGIALTTFYVIGMIERRDRIIFRMGYDSVAVLVCYAAGLVILYGLR